MSNPPFDDYSGIAEMLRSGTNADAESVKLLWKLLGVLQSATMWEESELAEHLGCSLHVDGVATERIAHSIAYISWLVTLTESVDLPVDARSVVVGAFDVVSGAPGPTPAAKLAAAEAAFDSPADGSRDLAPRTYLKLGEVTAAWHGVARRLGSGAAFERARRLDALGAPLRHLSQHLDPERVRLLEGDNALADLGVAVARRMARHREGCSVCAGAVHRERALVLRQAA